MTNAAETIPVSPTESDFFRHWQVAAAGAVDEASLALATGAVADRLAWVFMSGYQAAVRRCFPEFMADGWTCLAVAEPKDGPACELESDSDGYLLNGCKSWIAGSDTVQNLVVSVGADPHRHFVRVPVDSSGVTLSHPRSPTFLIELSQGAARFDDVRLPAGAVLAEPARAQWFRGGEPLYVLMALNACLARHAVILGASELEQLARNAIDIGRTLPPHLGEKSLIVPGLRSLRAATTTVIEAAAEHTSRFPPAFGKSWEADALLFGMFGISSTRP